MQQAQQILQQKEVNCPNHHTGKLICFNPACKQNVIICSSLNCDNCTQKHDFCKNYKIQTLARRIIKKRQELTQDVQEALKAIQKIFDQAIDKLSIQREYYRDQHYYLGLNQLQIDFLRKMHDGTIQQMSAKQVSRIMRRIQEKNQWAISDLNIKKYWERHAKSFKDVFDNLKALCFRAMTKIPSKIVTQTSETQVLAAFFPRKIKGYKLLFRASQQAYSVQNFHTMCDGKTNILIIAETQHGKKIGGWTPIAFKSGGNGYQKDKKGQSFLFSISNQQKYPLIKADKALQLTGKYFGPIFGNKEFSIGNACNTSATSTFSLGKSYQYPDKYQNQVKASQAFTGGTTSPNVVKIIQWEVFQTQ